MANEMIEDETFVIELKIFWQNVDEKTRNKFFCSLEDYFGFDRAVKIKEKLQERV